MINKKTYNNLLAIFVMASIWFIGSTAAAAAADKCKTLYQGINKERVLIKKKELVDAAIKVCPNDPDIVYQKGYIMERFRKYEEALTSYRKTVKLDPSYAKAYFSIGDIKALLNSHEEAVVAYRQGLRHDPGNARAKSSLQESLSKIQGSSSAQQAVVAAPTKPPVVAVSPTAKVEKKEVKEVASKSAPRAKTASSALAPIVRLNIPFEGRSTDLSRQARDVLDVVVGQAMKRDDMRDVRFELGGHTDNSGSVEKNAEIGRQRAAKVKEYLTGKFGIDSARLITIGYGQKKPKVPNNSSANRSINNRVEFIALD